MKNIIIHLSDVDGACLTAPQYLQPVSRHDS